MHKGQWKCNNKNDCDAQSNPPEVLIRLGSVVFDLIDIIILMDGGRIMHLAIIPEPTKRNIWCQPGLSFYYYNESTTEL